MSDKALPRSPKLRQLAGLSMMLALPSLPGLADTMRFGVHPNFDRVVVPLAAASPYVSREANGILVVEATGFGVIADMQAAGVRISHIAGGTGRMALTLPSNGRRRLWRSGDKLVVDIFDAVTKSQSGALHDTPVSHATSRLKETLADKPAASVPPPSRSPVAPAVPPPPATQATPPTASFAIAAPQIVSRPAPTAGAVQIFPPDATYPDGSLLVRAAADIGAAAFDRSGTAHVVFDAAVPLDLSALKDHPVYGGTTARILEAGAELQLQLQDARSVRIVRHSDGWQIGVVRQPAAPESASPASFVMVSDPGQLLLATEDSSAVVVLDDAATGTRLLVGTQRRDGLHVPALRRTPEYTLFATTLGVVVEAASDRLEMRSGPRGFRLGMGAGPGLSTEWTKGGGEAASDASAMTRRFDFPDLPLPMLRNRLHDAMRDEVMAPRLARHEARLRTVQAMLSLGMDVEALAALHVAAADEPQAKQAQDGAALRDIAAWLARRPGETIGTRHAELSDGTDEGTLWQAALSADVRGGDQPAMGLAATWKLASSYPEPLRRIVLPRLAEALIEGGQKSAAAALLKANASPSLDLARAELAQADGRVAEALRVFDDVSTRPDRDAASRARRQSVELRLQHHDITPKEAAIGLQGQIFAWRGDKRELNLRLRVAALLEQSGEWRPALELLRETDRLFPEAHDPVSDAETGLVAHLLKDNAASRLAPLDLVALVAECADLFAYSPAASVLAPVLVDKLLALDLPDRAEPILARMAHEASAPAPKAELGLRLAELRLARDDRAGAASALEDTKGDGLDDGLQTRRTLFRARLLASIGDQDGALRLLGTMSAPEAFEQAATLLEHRHDWKSAADSLSRLLAVRVGSSGKLNDSQADLVLRFASDAAQSGDGEALRQLRDSDAPRFPPGSRADLLRVLTESPVHAVADLPRAGEELVAARTLPAALSGPQAQ